MASIVIYFSRAEENCIDGSIVHIEKGNTEIIAEQIAQITGADLFKVEPKEAYPKDYYYAIETAREKKENSERPEIKAFPQNIEKYDTIYLGFPIYWETMPMHMFTLLENIDTTGKTIKPFCTHEGSHMGYSEGDILKLCRGAIVKKGLGIKGTFAQEGEIYLKRWLED